MRCRSLYYFAIGGYASENRRPKDKEGITEKFVNQSVPVGSLWFEASDLEVFVIVAGYQIILKL